MIIWRIWFVHNEITHDKPPPAIEGSRRFLCSYVTSLTNARHLPIEDILRGKHKVHVEVVPVENSAQFEKLWTRPPEGSVKLNVDGSFFPQDGKA
jgi:hypothetical protein